MQEAKTTALRRDWDAAVPSGVPPAEHYKSLALTMVTVYFSVGRKGVFLVHPIIASVFAVIDPLRFGNYRWRGESDKPQLAGHVGGIELWVEESVGNEVLVTDDPEDLQPRARITFTNFDFCLPNEPLDRMAHIA